MKPEHRRASRCFYGEIRVFVELIREGRTGIGVGRKIDIPNSEHPHWSLGFGERSGFFSRIFKGEGIINGSGNLAFSDRKHGETFGKGVGGCRVEERETKGDKRERNRCDFA